MDEKRLNSQSPYQWDEFSDQPLPIRDKVYKRRIRIYAIPAFIKLLLVSVLSLPFTLIVYFILPRFQVNRRIDRQIGLCVNLDKEAENSPALVKELGVECLSLRIPLADVANIEDYLSYARSFKDVSWLFVILQDREHIDDLDLLRSSLKKVFEAMLPVGNEFQIANAINRTKWGFSSIDEYLKFFKIAQTLRDTRFPEIKLLGSAVIDFEVYALLRSLWHFANIKYDGVAALLYVDRRGAPENKQFAFDLVGKLNFFWAALSLSPKTKNRLIINETNWPIENTRPYAPALDDVWVSEEDYSNYMLRYYLLALANGNAACIYWHQLVSPGYGLIDNRDNDLGKRRAFKVFKQLCEKFQGAVIHELTCHNSVYVLSASDAQENRFTVRWRLQGVSAEILSSDVCAVDAAGFVIPSNNGSILVAQEPVYFCSI